MRREIESIFASLFEGLDVPRRWLSIIGLVLMVILLAVCFEYVTGFNFYRSLEKKTELMRALHALSKDDIDRNPELHSVYKSTVQELAERKADPFAVRFDVFSKSAPFWKAVSGASIWIVLMVLTLLGTFGQQSRVAGAVGMGLFGVLAGFISSTIPTIYDPWVNYLGIPFIQLMLIIAYGMRIQRNQRQANA